MLVIVKRDGKGRVFSRQPATLVERSARWVRVLDQLGLERTFTRRKNTRFVEQGLDMWAGTEVEQEA